MCSFRVWFFKESKKTLFFLNCYFMKKFLFKMGNLNTWLAHFPQVNCRSKEAHLSFFKAKPNNNGACVRVNPGKVFPQPGIIASILQNTFFPNNTLTLHNFHSIDLYSLIFFLISLFSLFEIKNIILLPNVAVEFSKTNFFPNNIIQCLNKWKYLKIRTLRSQNY